MDELWVTLSDLDAARQLVGAGARALALRRAAQRVAERLCAAPRALRLEVLELDRIPIGAHAALDGALAVTMRWLELSRRALYLELPRAREARPLRVLVDPVEPGAWQRTPWGARFAERRPRRTRALGRGRSIERALGSIGVPSEAIDIVVVTHLRGQDLRRLVGTVRGDGLEGPHVGLFPRAIWFIPRLEWEDARAPHPHEVPHLVRGGLDRIDTARVVFFDRDVAIASSAALIRTPGLTTGHASLFVRGPEGVLAWTSSGVAVDCWSPYHARIPGLRARARELDAECVPRGDSASRLDALSSMAIERAIADRRADEPAFHQILPQQELVPGLLVRPVASRA
jgi:hypothetical protein